MATDEFHNHEALDRTHVILCILEEHLLTHPVVLENANVQVKIEQAAQLLADAYQLIGQLPEQLPLPGTDGFM